MKKKVAITLLFGLLISVALIAQTNEQRIIGRWVDDENVIWVINSNGTINRNNRTLSYGITGVHIFTSGWGGENNFRVFDYSMSSDGKTVIMISIHPAPGFFESYTYLLRKQ